MVDVGAHLWTLSMSMINTRTKRYSVYGQKTFTLVRKKTEFLTYLMAWWSPIEYDVILVTANWTWSYLGDLQLTIMLSWWSPIEPDVVLVISNWTWCYLGDLQVSMMLSWWSPIEPDVVLAISNWTWCYLTEQSNEQSRLSRLITGGERAKLLH